MTSRKGSFWKTQPVPQRRLMPQHDSAHTTIQPSLDFAQAGQLPSDSTLSFCTVAPSRLEQVSTLLSQHYLGSHVRSRFHVTYDVAFLTWALRVPGHYPDWLVGLQDDSGQLVGFIAGTPCRMRLDDHEQVIAVVDLLCVARSLRDQALAPQLIRELTFRVSKEEVKHAVFTTEHPLPGRVLRARYRHRPIDAARLIGAGFMDEDDVHVMPEVQDDDSWTRMTEEHAEQALDVLNKHLSQFAVAVQLDDASFRHWFLAREDSPCFAYVRCDEETGRVRGMLAFFVLTYAVDGEETEYDSFRAAQAWYVVPGELELEAAVTAAVRLARDDAWCHVFSALDTMNMSRAVLSKLGFVQGGHLDFHLFNWMCPLLTRAQVSYVPF